MNLEDFWILSNETAFLDSYNEDVPSFDSRSHWEGELRRTGAVVHAWRVTHVNTSRRYVEG